MKRRRLVGVWFTKDRTSRPQTLGPFVAVQVAKDGVFVTTPELTLPVIAVPVSGGWEVCGLEGEVYESLSVFAWGRKDDG